MASCKTDFLCTLMVSHPWLGSGVQCHQETVPHLNFHVLELGKLVPAVCYSDTFFHLLHELHRALVCFLSDYCHWLSLSGISPGLHSHLRSGLQVLHFTASMSVMVFLLILFGFLQVHGNILLVDTSKLNQAVHHW